jgi:hypothetical protein
MAQSFDGNGGKFRVNAPNPIQNASLTALDPRQRALTTISISFQTETLIPMGGYLQFEFDHIFYVFPSDKDQISCTTNLV